MITAQQQRSKKLRLNGGVASIVEKEFYFGVNDTTSYTGVAADYFDFRNDGKVYSYVDGAYGDTAVYTILDDSHVRFYYPTYSEADTFEIKTLTENSLVLYSRQVSGANYTETTGNLKK
jgi:hypothetical protein